MVATLTLVIFLTALPTDPPPIKQAEVKKVHAELLSKTTETWETIPWGLDLLRARARSAREGKPLFIWSMNGHPLGCV